MFSNLPVLIIDNILDYCVLRTDDDFSKDNMKLNCLQISTLWQRIGVSKYYYHAYYSDYYEDEENQTATNIGLITSVSKVNQVRKLTIKVFHLYQMIEFLNRYETLFKANSNDWSSVTGFEIYCYNDITVPDSVEYNGETINLQEKFLEFVRFVTRHMPAISKARIFYLDLTETTNLANTLFLNTFSRQLKCFSGDMVSCFNNDYSFDNLTFIKLNLNPATEIVLPKLNCIQLKYFSLINIPYTFQWNNLFKDNSIKQFKFISLEYLTLFFFSNDHEDKEEAAEYIANNEASNINFKLELYFPQLKSLFLGNTPSWFAMRTKYNFPDHLRRVIINGAQAAYPLLKDINFENVINCHLVSLRQDKPFDSNFYLLSNKIFNAQNYNENKNVRLTLWDTQKYVDWTKTNWNLLLGIELKNCNIETFALIHKYSKGLQYAIMNTFNVDISSLDKMQCLFNQEGSNVTQYQHSSTSNGSGKRVCHFFVHKFKDIDSKKDSINLFVKFYLKWATNLRHLKLNDDRIFDINEFIARNRNEYNLENVFVSRLEKIYC